MTLSSRKRSCADRLKMLADDTRLSVLRQLVSGPKFVYQLNERLGLEQSLMSHHLRTLRREGLVTSRRIGKAVQYRLTHRVSGRDEIDLGCCRICFD